MTIRHVTTADADAWARLREALWPGDPHLADIAAFFAGTLREPEAVLIAEPGPGQPVAFVELSIRRDLPGIAARVEAFRACAPTGYVEGLYVEPSHRAGGTTTRRLLRAAQTWARQRRCAFFASDRDDRVIFDRAYRAA